MEKWTKIKGEDEKQMRMTIVTTHFGDRMTSIIKFSFTCPRNHSNGLCRARYWSPTLSRFICLVIIFIVEVLSRIHCFPFIDT